MITINTKMKRFTDQSNFNASTFDGYKVWFMKVLAFLSIPLTTQYII